MWFVSWHNQVYWYWNRESNCYHFLLLQGCSPRRRSFGVSSVIKVSAVLVRHIPGSPQQRPSNGKWSGVGGCGAIATTLSIQRTEFETSSHLTAAACATALVRQEFTCLCFVWLLQQIFISWSSQRTQISSQKMSGGSPKPRALCKPIYIKILHVIYYYPYFL